ncbi:hypothetical protein M422DRAFT_210753 [Sphaerobolus stellatus SS14]|uniref:N-acetyl-D-glucosamine kinase n=1 Tax=Sphaerobolus stellatus (strain SS14) TaxID=990650 RepID=A0A0C9VLJ4_SPHS4|nr:hypothetical protein M422DRAFT_210753 [Sphaerobolus stellatus SS14]
MLELHKLTTEAINPLTVDISSKTTHEILKLINDQDALVYVKGGLKYAQSLGCLTIVITCTDPNEMSEMKDDKGDLVVIHSITAVVGPEVVTGSTRMKAGTVTKLILNMLSTGSMIRLGKTYGNLMVDVRVSNFKLKARGYRLIRTVCNLPDLSEEKMDELLASCDGSVKLAIVVARTGWSIDKARETLFRVGGRLADLLPLVKTNDTSTQANYPQPLYLCVDGGGTNTRAIFASLDSDGNPVIVATGKAGSSNVSAIGIPFAIATIKIAIEDATSSCFHGSPCLPIFAKAWIGCAGIDTVTRPSTAMEFTESVANLLQLEKDQLQITSDASLLSDLVSPGIIIISGTGSIAIRFDEHGNQTARAGGLGYLLGDEGSGFDIGRQAIRVAIEEPGKLQDAILAHFRVRNIQDLITAVYRRDDRDDETQDPKSRIANVAPIVLELAFAADYDSKSLGVVYSAARSLRLLVAQILPTPESSPQPVICTGGLFKNPFFRTLVDNELGQAGYDRIQYIEDPGLNAALSLARSKS